MLTELWESDAFTERKERLVDTIETEYHWSKGDIIVVTRGGGRELRCIVARGTRQEFAALLDALDDPHYASPSSARSLV